MISNLRLADFFDFLVPVALFYAGPLLVIWLPLLLYFARRHRIEPWEFFAPIVPISVYLLALFWIRGPGKGESVFGEMLLVASVYIVLSVIRLFIGAMAPKAAAWIAAITPISAALVGAAMAIWFPNVEGL